MKYVVRKSSTSGARIKLVIFSGGGFTGKLFHWGADILNYATAFHILTFTIFIDFTLSVTTYMYWGIYSFTHTDCIYSSTVVNDTV